jgi:hypothetical protein
MPTASELLTQTESAIAALLVALADSACQEYQLPDGRRVRRAEFAQTLTALQNLRDVLRREVNAGTRSPVRVGRFGRVR